MPGDELAYLEVVLVFSEGVGDGVSHLREEKGGGGGGDGGGNGGKEGGEEGGYHLQPAYEEDKLKNEDDGEEELCVGGLHLGEGDWRVERRGGVEGG